MPVYWGTLTEDCMEFYKLLVSQLHTQAHCPTNEAHIDFFSYSLQAFLRLFFAAEFKKEKPESSPE